MPEDSSLDTTLSAAYGELSLSPERKYWVWPVELPLDYSISSHDQLFVDYEIRTLSETKTPDLIVVDQEGREKYEATVDPPILYKAGQRQFPLFGSVPWQNIYLENFSKFGKSNEVIWEEDEPTYSSTVIECLSKPASSYGSLRHSEAVSAEDYYVIFDWTEEVLRSPSSGEVSAEVSVRVRQPPDEEISEQVEPPVTTLYSRFDRADLGITTLCENIAERLCIETTIPSIGKLQEAAPRGTQLASTLNVILTILQEEIGYRTIVGEQVANITTTWTKWWMATLPLTHSIRQLHEDACAVTEAPSETINDRVEDFLLSLGILISDIVLLKTGLVNRYAAHAVKMTHRYLLGFLRKTLGLRAYIILLREFYNLVRSSTARVLAGIKSMTREIVEETELLDQEDQSKINQLNGRSLRSLDSTDFDLTSNLLNPECNI